MNHVGLVAGLSAAFWLDFTHLSRDRPLTAIKGLDMDLVVGRHLMGTSMDGEYLSSSNISPLYYSLLAYLSALKRMYPYFAFISLQTVLTTGKSTLAYAERPN